LSQEISTSHLVDCSFRARSSVLELDASASEVTSISWVFFSNLALQLGNLGLMADISLFKLLGHIIRRDTVLVASFDCCFLIRKDLKLKNKEAKDLKLEKQKT
jgi:hypothetical protein